jgi:PAS domain S-box-containing protein
VTEPDEPRPDLTANPEDEFLALAGVAYLVTDAFGMITEANVAAGNLLGVSPPQLIGKPLARYVTEVDRREFRIRLLELKPQAEPRRWRLWLTPRRGSPFLAELRVSRNEDGSVGTLSWTLDDITKQTSAEAELRVLASELEQRVSERTHEVEAERARLAAVVEQIPAGLMILGADERVLLANAEARRLLGDQVIEGIEGIEGLPSGNESLAEGRAEIAREGGSQVVLDVWIAPILDAGGQRVGVMQLFQDISLRESRERAEREFVTNAAHQLQSPLAGIISAVEVLQAGAKDGSERDVFLGHIEREANRLARLTRALLTLARAQTGVETPRDEVVALEPLLSEVQGALRPAPGVAVAVDCPPGLAVVTNRALVEQALLNVAENAAKYTLQGRITLAAHPRDGGVEILVSDTGPGIPERERRHVMERFFRGAANTPDGFGLGIAIVRSAIDALGGEVELEAPESGGTVVRILLKQAAHVVRIE